MFTLAARGLARREDIDALPRLDPVTGEVNRATCLAMQPDLAAKEAAWTVALSSGELARIAQACAAGIWVPGQEELMAGYGDRYFTEVLPRSSTKAAVEVTAEPSAVPGNPRFRGSHRGRDAAEPSDNVLRLAVAEQATIMRRRLAARQRH